MAKKEKSLEESKKKKVPFNVLRKGAIAGLLGLTIGIGCLGLAGCSNGTDGKDGINGKDGAQWYSGIETPTTQGVNGDFYLDTDDYILYQKTNGEWTVLMRDFGKPATATNIELQVASGKVQWRYTTGDDTTWKDLIEVDTITGDDGREIELQVGSEYIQWRYTTGTDITWKNLMLISSLKGTDGATWLSGTTEPTTTQGKNGDFYLNESNYDIYKKTDGAWNKIGNIKGENGLTPYVGYDGYMWTTKDRSNAKVVDVLSENVRENTILLGGNEYFESTAISLNDNQIALMNTYLPSIKKTAYSGVSVREIQIYAKTAGTLTVGTASVESIVDRTGSVTTNDVETFDVVAGINTLTFDVAFEVGENETIVLGKNGDTAKLVYYSGIETDDDQGVFANLSNTDLYSTSNSVKNKIAIRVTADVSSSAVETQEGLDAYLKSSSTTFKQSVVMKDAPYTIANITKYAGITVHHIDLGVKTITAKDENQYITVYKVKQSTVTGNKQYLSNVLGTYKFYAKASSWEDVDDTSAVNKLVSFYCNETVTVGSDETLVFGNSSDPIQYACGTCDASSTYKGFYYSGGNSSTTSVALSINVWKVDNSGKNTWKNHIEELKEQEQESTFRGLL